MSFKDKSVLITGGSSGIGKATAIAFAREGAKILIADVNADSGANTIAELQNLGAEAQYITADMRSESEVKTMVNAVIERYGRLDIAVNNAGVSGDFMAPVTDTTLEQYELVMDVNVKGVWLCMRAEIPQMLQQGGGVIINMASVAGLLGAPGGSIYAASKHAVIGLTRSVALEYARHNIRINAVCPSYTETPMVTQIAEVNPRMDDITRRASPMKRLGQPEEIASAVLWLASDGASFVNGSAIPVDGGLTAM